MNPKKNNQTSPKNPQFVTCLNDTLFDDKVTKKGVDNCQPIIMPFADGNNQSPSIFSNI